jgi:hypothetical protein
MNKPVPSLEEIISQWEEDSQKDQSNPNTDLLKIGYLHQKYLGYLAHYSLLAKKMQLDYLRLRGKKWTYYSGFMPKEELKELGWEPFLHNVKQKESIEKYIEQDNDLINILAKKAVYDEATEYCKNVIKEIYNRSWQLKASVDWLKFSQGSM